MAQDAPTVADIFRRAQAAWRANPQLSLAKLKDQLMREYERAQFPPMDKLAIPEQDARAPEEDWSAGLSIVRRGIQTENWGEVIDGVLFSLDQTERYERERGALGYADDWHDRSVGIREQTAKGVGKWMPEDLMRLAERNVKK